MNYHRVPLMFLALVAMACSAREATVDHVGTTSLPNEGHAQVTTSFHLDVLYADGDCTLKEAMAAEAIASFLDTPERLLDFFRTYAHCDDGTIAEETSESVTLLLDSDWEQVVELAEYARRDPAFGDFVARHVDETADEDRVDRIREKARARCPEKAKELCRSIVRGGTGGVTLPLP
jgi:hypothetical protein